LLRLGQSKVNIVESDLIVGHFELLESCIPADGSCHYDIDLVCSKGGHLLLAIGVLGLKVDEDIIKEEHNFELIMKHAISFLLQRY
jgi:hypothetical protein